MNAFGGLTRTISLCRDYVADDLTDGQIGFALQSLRVLCVADASNLSTHSGQTSLVTLVSLLSRMGMQVGLKIPSVGLLKAQIPLAGSELRSALTWSSERLMPGATVVIADKRFSPDIILGIGNSEIALGDVPCWRLTGTNWSGSIIAGDSTAAHTWSIEWPIGGMVAALLAANEAFKFAMRRLRLREDSDRIFFEPSPACSWDFGEIPLPEAALDLADVDLISAGAISQACLYALARIPHVQLRGRIFDDDVTEISNLNRNMLTLAEDVGVRKVNVVSTRCGPDFLIQHVPYRFGAPEARIQLASRVLVGVDDIPSRWAAQRAAQKWLAVSGTSHFSVSSSAHMPGQPCCGCLHPIDDPGGANPIPTVSFVSFWAGLAMAVQLVREALRMPYPPDRQHLWLTPLRLDQPRAGMWLPVPSHRNCPVRCLASQLCLSAA